MSPDATQKVKWVVLEAWCTAVALSAKTCRNYATRIFVTLKNNGSWGWSCSLHPQSKNRIKQWNIEQLLQNNPSAHIARFSSFAACQKSIDWEIVRDEYRTHIVNSYN